MSAWETFRRSLRRREPSTPWLSPEDTYGSAEPDVLDLLARDHMYALAERDKHKRRADALAVEVEQLKARLAEAKDERDGLVQSLAATARRNGELASMIEASPDRVRQACLDLSDEVFGLRRRNAELQRERAS